MTEMTEFIIVQNLNLSYVEEIGKLKSDLAKLSEENTMFLGHTNSKQKIHYLGSLKQQIHELAEENQRLRELGTNKKVLK